MAKASVQMALSSSQREVLTYLFRESIPLWVHVLYLTTKRPRRLLIVLHLLLQNLLFMVINSVLRI